MSIGEVTRRAGVKASDRSDGDCNRRGDRNVSHNDEVSQQISAEGSRMPCLWPARCVNVSAVDWAGLASM